MAAFAVPVLLTSCGDDDKDEPIYIPPVTQPSSPVSPGDNTEDDVYVPFEPKHLCDTWRLTGSVTHNGKEYAPIDVRFTTSNPVLLPEDDISRSQWQYEVDINGDMYPFIFYAFASDTQLYCFNILHVYPVVEDNPHITYSIAGMVISENSVADTYEMDAVFKLLNTLQPEECIKEKRLKLKLVRE